MIRPKRGPFWRRSSKSQMNKLEEIVAYKRQEVAEAKRQRPVGQLERVLKTRPPVRSFRQAINRPGNLSLIAEFKRASPSAGPIRAQADPLAITKVYAEAGAQALSILTDTKFFSGSLRDLTQVKEKARLPVLRKDFLFDEYQIVESAAAGADGVLLIAAILKRPDLKRLLTLARDLNLDALVEVHSEKDLGEALEVEAELIGINNRDLGTLAIDLKTTGRLMDLIPKGKTVVSESGLHSRADVEFVAAKGAHAVLIGEELMSSPDIAKRIKELMGW